MAGDRAALVLRIAADLETLKSQLGEAGSMLQVMSGHMRETSAHTSELVGKLEEIGRAVGIGFGVAEIVSFAKEVIATGAEIHTMAERLDVSAETVQRWKYALEQSDGSLNAFQRSVQFLNRTLGKDEAGTAAMLELLGLSLEELRLEDTEQRVRSVTTAIAAVKDPVLQDQAAFALLGRGAGENMAAIKKGMDEVGAQAIIMSDQTVSALDRSEKAWKSVGNAIVVASGMAIAGVESLVERYRNLAEKGEAQRLLAEKGMEWGAAEQKVLYMTREELDKLIASLQKHNTAASEFVGPVREQKTAIDVLNLTLDNLDKQYAKLSASDKQGIADAKARGASVAEIAAAYTLAAPTVDRVLEAYKKSSVETERLDVATEKYQEVLGRMTLLIDGAGMSTGEWAKQLFFAGASLEDVKQATGLSAGAVHDLKEEVDGEKKLEEEWAKLSMKLHAEVLEDWRKFVDEQIRLADKRAKAIIENLKIEQRADEESTKERAHIAVMLTDQQIDEAKRSHASTSTIRDLEIQKARIQYDEEVRLIQEKSKKQKEGLDTDVGNYDGALEKIKTDTDLAMTAAGLTFKTRVDDATDEATKKYDAFAQHVVDEVENVIHDGITKGWKGVKDDILSILNDILSYFEKQFVKALIGWALGVDNAWSSAFRNIAGYAKGIAGISSSATSAAGTATTTAGTVGGTATTTAGGTAAGGGASAAASTAAGVAIPLALMGLIWNYTDGPSPYNTGSFSDNFFGLGSPGGVTDDATAQQNANTYQNLVDQYGADSPMAVQFAALNGTNGYQPSSFLSPSEISSTVASGGVQANGTTTWPSGTSDSGTPGAHVQSDLHFASGGIVPGPDYGYDTYRAMLRGGETILTPEQTRAIEMGGGGDFHVHIHDPVVRDDGDIDRIVDECYRRLPSRFLATGRFG
jgi:hypothetical protein